MEPKKTAVPKPVSVVGGWSLAKNCTASHASLETHMSRSLKFLKGRYIGDYIGEYHRGY